MPSTVFAVEPGELGKAFLARQRGKADDDSPQMRKVCATNRLADSFEKPLAEWRKSLYTEHRTSRLWFGEKFLRFFTPNHNEMSLFDAIPIIINWKRLLFESFTMPDMVSFTMETTISPDTIQIIAIQKL